jgi:hypothetical protein
LEICLQIDISERFIEISMANIKGDRPRQLPGATISLAAVDGTAPSEAP